MLQSIPESKLKAFSIGAMNQKKGLSKKEQEELKKKVGVMTILKCMPVHG